MIFVWAMSYLAVFMLGGFTTIGVFCLVFNREEKKNLITDSPTLADVLSCSDISSQSNAKVFHPYE